MSFVEVVVLWFAQRLLGWYARRHGQTAVVLLYGLEAEMGAEKLDRGWPMKGPERPQ